MTRFGSIIFLTLLLVQACTNQTDLTTDAVGAERYAESVSGGNENAAEIYPDSIFYEGRSVVFYTPTSSELEKLSLDKAAKEGLHQAVGDFAYYASIVSDSLQSTNIGVHFTNRSHIVFGTGDQQFEVDRKQTGSPIGLILFDGQETPKVLAGMQTHLSLLASISDYFYDHQPNLIPLLDYFNSVEVKSIHVYSSHSDILNQTGNRIDPFYYSKLGVSLAQRASKFRMSVFAYNMFLLKDSLVAIICRVPSRYDESSVRLYIWDNNKGIVLQDIELAENIWNEKWIMVKDSWLSIPMDSGNFSIVQRKKEARMEEGQRTVIDSLYKWQWTGSHFNRLSVEGLSTGDYPLKDWDSYQEPKKATEITIVDQDYVWLPLQTGDLTWENVILALPRPYSIEKEPIPNQLVANQIDTLVSISRPNVKFTFYRSPEDNIAVGGTISDSSLEFKKGLKVGMSKVEFAAVFEKLNGATIPNLIKLSSNQQDRVISYFFKNDTLVRIEFTNYIH